MNNLYMIEFNIEIAYNEQSVVFDYLFSQLSYLCFL